MFLAMLVKCAETAWTPSDYLEQEAFRIKAGNAGKEGKGSYTGFGLVGSVEHVGAL